MSKLSGQAIAEARREGFVVIEPWNRKNLGPNSYDLTLSSEICKYALEEVDTHTSCHILDVKKPNKIVTEEIDSNGYVLYPGNLYLACTNEVAGSARYVPGIEGRSSIARLGIKVHFTAGFGDVGYVGKWTLEMECIHPVRIYENMRICQVYFDTLEGEINHLYGDGTRASEGKYNHAVGTMSSQAWRDFDDT